ncbi:MAG: glycosyltransferase family 4 protein [Methylobacter sp.]
MKIAVVNLITRTPTKHKVPPIDSNKDAMIVKLALEMQALGHEVVLYVSDLYKPIHNEDLGLEVVYLKTHLQRLPEIPFVPSLIGQLRNNYDIVLTSEAFQWATIFAVLARLFSWKNKPKIFVWQELAIHQRTLWRLPSIFFHQFLLKFILDWMISYYIPRGIRAKRFLVQQGLKDKKIGSCIPHGVDSNVFFHQASNSTRKYILSPARLVEEKGIDVLLRAIRIIRNEGLDIDLIIQGDGPSKEIYEKMAIEMEIDKFVFFNQVKVNHEEMRKLYSGALITVVASRRDNLLLSVMESLACGTPVIVSDAADNAEEISEYGGGFVFPCDNHLILAKQVMDILMTEGVSAELKEGVIYAAERYKNSNIAAKLISEFQKAE